MSGAPVTVRLIGGVGEIGMNMAAVEVEGKIALLDVGLIFPDVEHHGVDLVLPDWEVLRPRAADIHCIVLTHGHEDHYGAVPYFLRDFPGVPIYSSRLTLGLLEAKLTEHEGIATELRPVEAGERVRTEPFDFEFVHVTHSFPDSMSVAFHTPQGTILFSGDFRLDQTPVDGWPTDLPHFAQLGDAGVALFLCDSTNADRPGVVPSEKTVGTSLREEFARAEGRVVCATFASHIHRVQQVIDAAKANERVVCFVGRSMVRNMPIARDLGYLTYDDRDVVDMKELASLPHDRIVIVCTGSQGEPYAALSLMAAGQHRTVQLGEDDTVVMASSIIPGNEQAIYRSINGMTRQGATVVHEGIAHVHVSGHAASDELRLVHNVVRPTHVVPVHGEERHLHAHRRIAIETGTEPENVHLCHDGDVLELRDGEVTRGPSFPSGVVYVDGTTVGDVGRSVLRDRSRLAEGGVCAAAVTVDGHGRPTGEVILSQHGIVFEGEPDQAVLLEQAEKVLADELRGVRDPGTVAQRTQQCLVRFWKEQTGRKPVVVTLLVEG